MKKQDSFLDQITGYLTITFTNDRVKSVMSDHDIQIDGKPIHFAGMNDDSHYSVVAVSPGLISISSTDSVTHEATVTDYHFEGHDTMWTLMDAGRKTAMDPRAREYYRRVK